MRRATGSRALNGARPVASALALLAGLALGACASTGGSSAASSSGPSVDTSAELPVRVAAGGAHRAELDALGFPAWWPDRPEKVDELTTGVGSDGAVSRSVAWTVDGDVTVALATLEVSIGSVVDLVALRSGGTGGGSEEADALDPVNGRLRVSSSADAGATTIKLTQFVAGPFEVRTVPGLPADVLAAVPTVAGARVIHSQVLVQPIGDEAGRYDVTIGGPGVTWDALHAAALAWTKAGGGKVTRDDDKALEARGRTPTGRSAFLLGYTGAGFPDQPELTLMVGVPAR